MSNPEIIQVMIAFFIGAGAVGASALMKMWTPHNPWMFMLLMTVGGIMACIIVPMVPVKKE